MSDLLYTASDIAMIICIHDLRTKSQLNLLCKIWECEKLYLDTSILKDKKKFVTDVEHYCHYYNDKVNMDAEFPVIEKDVVENGGSIDRDMYILEFENLMFFFKNLRYRILYLEKKDYVRMKIRTIMKKYDYKRRSKQFNNYLEMCLSFYHIKTFSKGNVSCDITTEDIDVMISFKIC